MEYRDTTREWLDRQKAGLPNYYVVVYRTADDGSIPLLQPPDIAEPLREFVEHPERWKRGRLGVGGQCHCSRTFLDVIGIEAVFPVNASLFTLSSAEARIAALEGRIGELASRLGMWIERPIGSPNGRMDIRCGCGCWFGVDCFVGDNPSDYPERCPSCEAVRLKEEEREKTATRT